MTCFQTLRAAVPRAPEKGRHGLYQVTAPEDFRPIDALDRPDHFTGAELVRRVTCAQGVVTARLAGVPSPI